MKMHDPLLQIQFHTWELTTFDVSSRTLERRQGEQLIDVIEIGKITLYLTPAHTLKLRDVLNSQIAAREAEAATAAARLTAEIDAIEAGTLPPAIEYDEPTRYSNDPKHDAEGGAK